MSSPAEPEGGRGIRTVLFDLDGTLLDTAPDLADALNHVLAENGHPQLPYEAIRPVVSHGGIALIRLGFNMEPQHPGFEQLRAQLLKYYRASIAARTRPFDGIPEVLERIDASGMNWGVVTNKPGWLTDPLLQALGLLERAAVVVSGDTLDERKPHPAPMLYACEQAGSSPGQCVYIGDAERDIEAGRNAGMHTLVALFGYLHPDDTPQHWQADAMLTSPQQLLEWLEINKINRVRDD